MNELLLAIGFVLSLEGAPYLLFPRMLPRIVEFLSRADPLNLRLLGGFMIAVGLLMVYWVRTYA